MGKKNYETECMDDFNKVKSEAYDRYYNDLSKLIDSLAEKKSSLQKILVDDLLMHKIACDTRINIHGESGRKVTHAEMYSDVISGARYDYENKYKEIMEKP